MKKSVVLSCWLTGLLLLVDVVAASPGVVVRKADLRNKASFRGQVVERLAPGSSVTLGERRGGWQQITSSAGRAGWVRGYKVRAGKVKPQVVSTNRDDNRGVLSDLAALSRSVSGTFGSGSGKSGTQTTATIGIRGLGADELEAAKPDKSQLALLKKYGVKRKQGQAFAKSARLKKRKIKTL